MRAEFGRALRCPDCGEPLALEVRAHREDVVLEGVLKSPCGFAGPIVGGVPRLLPQEAAHTLLNEHSEFFSRHPDLRPQAAAATRPESLRTLRAFGDEWQRFPDLMDEHRDVFHWYFEGPDPVRWDGVEVLDAGCGMGRWLHFARLAGAHIVGMDVSAAIDVAAAREGHRADFVQGDLRSPPFATGSFDLVYCLGVLHHLEDPVAGVRALARLIRPGGQLRLYVYRTLDGEPVWKQALLAGVTGLRHVTTRLPYSAVHAVAWLVAAVATVLFLWPRRLLRKWSAGERLTRIFPLVHYADVPFRMLVSEQFDRLVAPIEGRFTKSEVARWLSEAGLEVEAILPGLGWRAIGRRTA